MSIEKVDSQVLNVPTEVTKEVLFGPKRTQALKVNFDSSTNSSANFNYQFAPKAIVTNDFMLEYTLTVQVVAPADAVPVGVGLFASSWGSKIAPRDFCLLWNIQTATLRLNDQVFTCQLSDLMPYISKCVDNKTALEYSDVGTALPDQGFYNYETAQGTLQNVLGSYNDARENWTPRGSWKYELVGNGVDASGTPTGADPVGVAGTATTGYVQLKMTTPFMIPPLHNIALNCPIVSLSNLYNININLNFRTDFAKALSVPTGWLSSSNGVSNVFGTAKGNLNLIMLTSYASDMMAIPAEVKIPNTLFDIKSQSVDAVNAGSRVLINSDIYQYDSYPDAFVFFCHKRSSNSIASDANNFLKLDEGFTININGDSSLLSGMRDSQLYQMCKKYVRMSFEEFKGITTAQISGVLANYATSGPLYVLRPAIDLPISSDGIAPNMSGYRIQMQFQNLYAVNNSTTNYAGGALEFVVISIRSGEVILTPSSGSQTANTISQADVVSALTKEPIYTNELKEMEGGRMRMTSAKSGRGKSGGAKSGGIIPLGTAVPRSHTTRF